MSAPSGFQLLSASPLAFVWRDFASPEECQSLLGPGETLRQSILTEEDAALTQTLRLFSVAHGPTVKGREDLSGVFRRVYCLPGSRKMRADFELGKESEFASTTDAGSSAAETSSAADSEAGHETVADARPSQNALKEASEGSCIRRHVLERFRSAVSDFLGQPPHDDEDSCVLNCTPGQRTEAQDGLLECGLHVDSNNGEPRRYATAILYLNSLPDSGGETVFPCSGDGPLRALGSQLLQEWNAESTELTEEEVVEAGDALEHCALHLESGTRTQLVETREKSQVMPELQDGIRAVRPAVGSLLLFFVRGEDGKIDPAAWHGSAAVFPTEVVKWTLQTFKAVPLKALPAAEDDDCLSAAAIRAIEEFAAEAYSEHSFHPRRMWPPVLLRGAPFLKPKAASAKNPLGFIGPHPVQFELFDSESMSYPLPRPVPLYSAHLLLGPLFGRLSDSASESTGLALWPAGLVLASYLVKQWSKSWHSVLELGCGPGLPGLTAAVLGAKQVVLSDVAAPALELAEANVRAWKEMNPENCGCDCDLRVANLDCRSINQEPHGGFSLEPESFDLILVADLLYDRGGDGEGATSRLNVGLLRTLRKFLGNSCSSQALISQQRRISRDHNLLEESSRVASEIGLEVEEVPAEDFGQVVSHMLSLLRVRRKE